MGLMPTPTELKESKAGTVAQLQTTVPAQSPLVGEKALRSSAFLALLLFFCLNWLALFLEPGAYYINTRKGLNMPEKVGMFLLRNPKPDILFMGSSRPCLGFDTSVAQAVLDRAKQHHTIMNMSVLATAFDFNNILLKNWILPNNPPKLIIYGCSEFDLFGTEIGKNRYRSLWRNMPYQHTISRWDDWWEYTDAELTSQLEFLLDQPFPLIRDRKIFRDALVILCRLYPVPLERRVKDYLSKPANEFTAKEVDEADANYKNYLPHYDMSKPNLKDMERFIAMAQSHHIELVFVNMPVSKRFRGYWQDGGVKIKQYRDLLASIAKRHGITYCDFYDADPSVFHPQTAFRDTNHLSKHGAKVITEKVISEQILPILRTKLAQKN
jgi:hypothetical protein